MLHITRLLMSLICSTFIKVFLFQVLPGKQYNRQLLATNQHLLFPYPLASLHPFLLHVYQHNSYLIITLANTLHCLLLIPCPVSQLFLFHNALIVICSKHFARDYQHFFALFRSGSKRKNPVLLDGVDYFFDVLEVKRPREVEVDVRAQVLVANHFLLIFVAH